MGFGSSRAGLRIVDERLPRLAGGDRRVMSGLLVPEDRDPHGPHAGLRRAAYCEVESGDSR
jgi:hypothetical protein